MPIQYWWTEFDIFTSLSMIRAHQILMCSINEYSVAVLGAFACLIISEVLPLINGRPNGIIHALLIGLSNQVS